MSCVYSVDLNDTMVMDSVEGNNMKIVPLSTLVPQNRGAWENGENKKGNTT